MKTNLKTQVFWAFAIGCIGLLIGCASDSRQPITMERLNEIRSATIPKDAVVKTSIRIMDKNKVLSAPSFTQAPGHQAQVEIVKEFVYPNDFELPMLVSKQSFPLTPTTPKSFTMQPVGVKVSLSPELNGGLVVLKGEIVITAFCGYTDGIGETAHPIISSTQEPAVMTENKLKLPMFREARTPLFVTALPGKTYKMKAAGPSGPVEVEVTCNLVPKKA